MNVAISECQFDMFSEPAYIQVLRDIKWFHPADLAIKLGYRHYSDRDFQGLWRRSIKKNCIVCRYFHRSKTPGKDYHGFNEVYRYTDINPEHHIEIISENGILTGRIYEGLEPAWNQNAAESIDTQIGNSIREIAEDLTPRICKLKSS